MFGKSRGVVGAQQESPDSKDRRGYGRKAGLATHIPSSVTLAIVSHESATKQHTAPNAILDIITGSVAPLDSALVREQDDTSVDTTAGVSSAKNSPAAERPASVHPTYYKPPPNILAGFRLTFRR